MAVEFGNVERVYNMLEGNLVAYVDQMDPMNELVEDVRDLVDMGSIQQIEGMSSEKIESTLRYLVETSSNFTELEDAYDASVLLTILCEYKIEWMKGAPILSTTWGKFVSSYEQLFTV